jgi:DNA-binding transcriptional ArsR family regulator
MGKAADRDRQREKALQHPTRQTLLKMLGDEGDRDVHALSALLPDDPSVSAVAYHLRVLRVAELVADPVEGRWRLA